MGRADIASVVIQEPEEIKLYKDGTELPDSSTLAESKAENGDTIAMAFALPGGRFPLSQFQASQSRCLYKA